jgi:hypothetical protein
MTVVAIILFIIDVLAVLLRMLGVSFLPSFFKDGVIIEGIIEIIIDLVILLVSPVAYVILWVIFALIRTCRS